MSTIIVKLDQSNQLLVTELIKKLGGNYMKVSDSAFEDFLLSEMMDREKTGKVVSRSTILKKLRSK
jgi:hypothetical protein